jgi:putative transposase
MIATQQLGKDIEIGRACRGLDVPRATYYRRLMPAVSTVLAVRRTHLRKLSDEKQAEVKALLYSEPMVERSPYQVFAKLLDDGRYLCSVRSMHRILAKDHASRDCRRHLHNPTYKMPELLATGPDQIWS